MHTNSLSNTRRLALLALLALSAAYIAHAQKSKAPYTVTDLGTLPSGGFSQATSVDDNGTVTGISGAADGTQRAVLWQGGHIVDITKHGLGGPNSGAFGVNAFGLAEGQAESTTKDPNNENFCAYGTGFECLPFLWARGQSIPLPLLGGNNGSVGTINKWGQVSGYVETDFRDSDCASGVTVNGTGPQVLRFEPVIWGPALGQIRQLELLQGDTVGVAVAINDRGQSVGASGTCADTLIPPIAVGPHAVLWQSDGTPVDLGNLGGTVDVNSLAVGNIALGLNNKGQVVGSSAIPDETGDHAFLWSKDALMQDLGTLPGDPHSVANAINDRGDIVGMSFDPAGNPRAFLIQNGVMRDLNTISQGNTSLYLLGAYSINSHGEIAGFGVQLSTGEVHAFVATPKHQ
jgi:probable HAF family extracellular repeat protein